MEGLIDLIRSVGAELSVSFSGGVRGVEEKGKPRGDRTALPRETGLVCRGL